MKNLPVLILFFFAGATLAACSQPSGKTVLPGYNLEKPTIFKMPPVLDEISGITFANGNPDTVYAEQDEEGRIFYFHPGDATPKHMKFGTNGDYEDIAICNGHMFVLNSNGKIISFPVASIGQEEVAGSEQNDLLDKGEYEAMYADETTHTLYVLCKSCNDDKGEQSVSGFIFSVAADGTLARTGQFAVEENTADNAEKEGKKGRKKLRPSALAKHPVTHEWYILSNVNKLLVVTDEHWKVLNTYPLGPALFNQPEGIVFDKSGNLYISNEIGTAGDATILKFLYHGKK
ncbi:MAG: SdiA-regulated domain-containing protein [Chitinophagaceae bacterium]